MSNPLLEHLADKTFTVTEYLDLVNELIGPLRVYVEGEITDLKILPQWVFFSLKDAESGAILRCGLHSGVYRKLGVNVEEGMQVKIEGYGKIAAKSGNFGFWVSAIEPKGQGALKRAYELLMQKLEKEGLFARKRPLPQCISHIGVISSRNGVVIQDLLQNLEKRSIQIDFVHSSVEGASSSEELERAIRFFNSKEEKLDVLVIIRGGGSLESLQGFNNESVVRSLYASSVPVLVGIGHDVDVPIAALVADWSASTPTAVAHVINASWAPLTEDMPRVYDRMIQRFIFRLREIEHVLEVRMHTIRTPIARIISKYEQFVAKLETVHQKIERSLDRAKETSATLFTSMQGAFTQSIISTKRSLREYERLLSVSDPNVALKRGYSLVYDKESVLVRSVKQVTLGETVRVRLCDGMVKAQITDKEY